MSEKRQIKVKLTKSGTTVDPETAIELLLKECQERSLNKEEKGPNYSQYWMSITFLKECITGSFLSISTLSILNIMEKDYNLKPLFELC